MTNQYRRNVELNATPAEGFYFTQPTLQQRWLCNRVFSTGKPTHCEK